MIARVRTRLRELERDHPAGYSLGLVLVAESAVIAAVALTGGAW